MMSSSPANWVWIVLVVALVAMHCGGCGGHGRHDRASHGDQLLSGGSGRGRRSLDRRTVRAGHVPLAGSVAGRTPVPGLGRMAAPARFMMLGGDHESEEERWARSSRS
jgi:hypothetical protein